MPKAKTEAPAEEVEFDYTQYLDREPSDLQERFADWIIEKTGKEFATKKEEAAWRAGVYVSVQLRMRFQASPENQAVLEARRSAAGTPKAVPSEKAKASVAPETVAPPVKAKGKKSVAAAPAPVEEPAEAVARPAVKRGKGGGKPAPF
jgi:hypothetical protein